MSTLFAKQFSKPLIPDQPTNDQLEQMLSYFNAQGAIDLHNQNARAQDAFKADHILRQAAQSMDLKEWQIKLNMEPLKIKTLALKNIFKAPGIKAFEGLTEDNIAVTPETSTTFLKAVRLLAANEARDEARRKASDPNLEIQPVALVPEGNYRKNDYNEKPTGVKTIIVPMDPTTHKITPLKYRETIEKCRKNGQTPVLLQMECPSNPWMQVYSREEQKKICDITEKNGMYLLHDAYLMGTESPELQDLYFAEQATAKGKQKVVTTYGMRRTGFVDSYAKVGFAITHNRALAEKLREYVTEQQIPFDNGNLTTSELIIKQLMTPENRKKLGEELEKSRKHAEDEISKVAGLKKVAVKSQAGPFVIMEFDDEMIKNMKKMGITNGYRAAEYFAVNGVTMMPLSIMSSGMDGLGFRINCSGSFDKGFKYIKETLDKIREGVSYGIKADEITSAYTEGKTLSRRGH